MRRQVRRMVVGLLGVAVVVGGGLVVRNLLQQRGMDLALEAVELLPEVAQRIQNFHRVKVDGDRKVWEVSAREARYFEDEEMVAVFEPEVAVYLEEGRKVGMSGGSGKVFLEDNELLRVEVEGDIDVQVDEYLLRTDSARYEADTDTVVAPGKVHLSSAQLEMDGEGVEVDLEEQTFRVSRRVRMRLWPKRS